MNSARPRALRVLLAALSLFAVLVFAACGETQDESDSSNAASSKKSDSGGGADPNAEIKQGLKTVSIPKQLGNPYEEYEHSGVDEALKELGGSNRITGPTEASASSQISIINAAVQQKPDAIIIAATTPPP
jgi:rhamnose transport system substrate-binding protein